MKRALAVVFVLLTILALPTRAEDSFSLDSFQSDNVAQVEKAAIAGDVKAQYRIGTMYLRGKAVEPDGVRAVKWLTKAAGQGYAPAQNRLGTIYLGGFSVSRNPAEARRWFTKAAAQGFAAAQRNLGAEARDDAEARRWYEKAAAQGDAESQYRLGQLSGKDRVQAQSWYIKAATAGYVGAQYALAEMLREDGSDEAAVSWLEKAAEHDHVPALARLAQMKEEGRGATKDADEAWALWQRAADGGDPGAQYRVGLAHQLGQFGLNRDPAQALVWYERAQAQGEARAAYTLALMYRNAEGTTANEEKALRFLREAAEHGRAEAQHDLGLVYARGTGGVPVDDVKACAWLALAVEQGDQDDRDLLNELKSRLSGTQLGEMMKEMSLHRGK